MYDYDLVICVYACDTIEKYKQQIIKMNEKYQEILDEYKNIKLIYFLGEEKTDLIGEQYVNLTNVKNDYLSASYKQNLGLKYIYENLKTKFIMCIGTDTYVNIKKLNLFLNQ
jgi:predicted nucleotide-binding protein (sugar kinase/HSP70/actin superfamily)